MGIDDDPNQPSRTKRHMNNLPAAGNCKMDAEGPVYRRILSFGGPLPFY
jgi:hypothetical protein